MCGSQSVVSDPAPFVWPGSLLEMQVLGPHPRPSESEVLEVGPGNLCFTSLLGDANAQSVWEPQHEMICYSITHLFNKRKWSIFHSQSSYLYSKPQKGSKEENTSNILLKTYDICCDWLMATADEQGLSEWGSAQGFECDVPECLQGRLSGVTKTYIPFIVIDW